MTDTAAMQRFTALYDTHHRQVFCYAVSRAGRQAADEIVSDTFLVAWRRFAELPEPALPWLLGVARNLIREQFRQSARQESLAAELRAWRRLEQSLESVGRVPPPATALTSPLTAGASLTRITRTDFSR